MTYSSVFIILKNRKIFCLTQARGRMQLDQVYRLQFVNPCPNLFTHLPIRSTHIEKKKKNNPQPRLMGKLEGQHILKTVTYNSGKVNIPNQQSWLQSPLKKKKKNRQERIGQRKGGYDEVSAGTEHIQYQMEFTSKRKGRSILGE